MCLSAPPTRGGYLETLRGPWAAGRVAAGGLFARALIALGLGRALIAGVKYNKAGAQRAPARGKQRQRPPWRFAHGREYFAILRGVRDDDSSQASAGPTTAAFDLVRKHGRASPTDAMPTGPIRRGRALLSRPPGLRPQRPFNYLPTNANAAYHQSERGWAVADCAGAGVSAFADVTAVPISPKNTPARTASASRRMRGVIKLTPFTSFGTASSQRNSSTGSGIRHATHRIGRAPSQTQTVLLAASCLSPTAMRMAT
jgi:hypothetical protein